MTTRNFLLFDDSVNVRALSSDCAKWGKVRQCGGWNLNKVIAEVMSEGEFVLHCAPMETPAITLALRHCSGSPARRPADGRYETSDATVRLLSVFVEVSRLSYGPYGSKRCTLTLCAAAVGHQSSSGAALKQVST